MSWDRAGDMIWIAGAMTLVGSALLVRWRQRSDHRMLRMASLWAAIFAILFAIAHWMDTRI